MKNLGFKKGTAAKSKVLPSTCPLDLENGLSPLAVFLAFLIKCHWFKHVLYSKILQILMLNPHHIEKATVILFVPAGSLA